MARNNDALADTSENQPRLVLSARSPPPQCRRADALEKVVEPCPRATTPFWLFSYICRHLPNSSLGCEEQPTTTAASQSEPIGIASRKVSAIEPGMVLSPS